MTILSSLPQHRKWVSISAIYELILHFRTTRLLNQTVHLLHRLAYYHDPPLNIRYKLNRAPVRHFNGILHKFTLTFGRLTYGAPPDWMSEELKVEIGVISGKGVT